MFASLKEIFCHIDDFCNLFNEKSKKFLLPNPNKKRQKPCKLSLAEVMTILVLFHLSDYRTFKHFYLRCVLVFSFLPIICRTAPLDLLDLLRLVFRRRPPVIPKLRLFDSTRDGIRYKCFLNVGAFTLYTL